MRWCGVSAVTAALLVAPTGCSVSGFVSSVYLRMFGAGCFIYSGRTYTTDLQSRLTRFRPMVLCVANILLSVDASIAQRQGVSPYEVTRI